MTSNLKSDAAGPALLARDSTGSRRPACAIATSELRDKVVGATAVGAARNGGQEVTLQTIHTAMLCQDMTFWNHYGELELFTANDTPVNEFRPSLAKYKGKIFPVDRVHSAWVGFEEEGKPGLNQLFMRDLYAMWLIEVNRPEERMLLERLAGVPAGKARQAGGVTAITGPVGLTAAAWSPNLLAYMTFDRFTLDANHFWIALLVAAAAGIAALVLPDGWMKRLLVGALIVAPVPGR